MRTEIEIKEQLAYYKGLAEGLRNISDKIKLLRAEAKVEALDWVLATSEATPKVTPEST